MIKQLTKSVLIPLGLTAAASAADAGIYKTILGSGNHSSSTTLIISNNEIEDFIKIVKSLEDSPKGVTETIQNEVNKQKEGLFSMLLGILDASLLGNILAAKEINGGAKGRGINKAGEGTIPARQGRGIVRVGYGHSSKKNRFLMPSHPLTNFETQN